MNHKFKKLRRYDDPGHAHSLTFTCFQRQRFLDRERSRRWFCDALVAACEKHRFLLWSYVIMPEHVHLLVCPEDREYTISAFCASLKVAVSRRAVNWVKENSPDFLPRMLDARPNGKRNYRFWQRGGGYDRNITELKTVQYEIDYIHANPIRRGLCERPEDWFWSSAADFAGIREEGPVPLDLDTLPPIYE